MRRPRLGPCMYDAVQMLHAHPETPQWDLCRNIGPHGSNAYGYRTLLRCEAAGLVRRRTRTEQEVDSAGNVRRAGTIDLMLTAKGLALAGLNFWNAETKFRELSR